MRDALGMANRVRDRDGAALRNAEKGEAVEPGGVDHRLEIGDEGLERYGLHVAVGQAVAAHVVADERVLARKLAIEPPPIGLSRSNSR